MTKEQHATLLNNIRTAENEAERSELLQQLDVDYGSVLIERESATEKLVLVEKERDTFARENNKLWIAKNVQESNLQQENENGDENTPPPKRSYADLEFKN